MVFRRTAPDAKRAIRLGGIGLIAPLAFIGGSLIIYWAGWNTNKILLIATLIGIVLYFTASSLWPRAIERPPVQSLKAALWLIVYLLFMLSISYAGSTVFGAPHSLIPYPWDLVVVAGVSLLFYLWGVRSGYKTKAIEELLAGLEETRTTGD